MIENALSLASSFYHNLPKSPAYGFSLAILIISVILYYVDDTYAKREDLQALAVTVKGNQIEYKHIRYDIRVTAMEDLVRDIEQEVDTLQSLADEGKASRGELRRLSKQKTELGLTRSKLQVQYANKPSKSK